MSHEDFTAAARDLRRLVLAVLVRCVEDERCSASFPHAFPAVLPVTTRTGEELEARVEANRGGRGNPLSDEDLARELPRQRREVPPGGVRGRSAARTLALPDAQRTARTAGLLVNRSQPAGVKAVQALLACLAVPHQSDLPEHPQVFEQRREGRVGGGT